MKYNELMAGDWITDEYKRPMQVYYVDMGRAYADSGCTLYEFNKDYPPQPIEITEDILKQNKWEVQGYTLLPSEHYYVKDEDGNHLLWNNGTLFIWFDYEKDNNRVYDILVPVKYVHQLQQVLRFAGMTELANSFNILI